MNTQTYYHAFLNRDRLVHIVDPEARRPRDLWSSGRRIDGVRQSEGCLDQRQLLTPLWSFRMELHHAEKQTERILDRRFRHAGP